MSAKFLNVNINIPFTLALSILPDIDLVVPMLQHGGPTHSIILYAAIGFPLIFVWKKRTIPYLIALASHPFVGDYLTRPSGTQGVQLLFPLTSSWYSAGSNAAYYAYIYWEIALFAAFIILMIATTDMAKLIKPHLTNLLLAIPILTALLPVFTQFPLAVPPELVIPHLILILLLAIPVIADIQYLMFRNH